MAAYTTEVESKSWFKVVLPVPSVRAELYKALHRAEQEYERYYGHAAEHDDAFDVLVTDYEIVIQFELPKES